jgi:hypothetical protein
MSVYAQVCTIFEIDQEKSLCVLNLEVMTHQHVFSYCNIQIINKKGGTLKPLENTFSP